MRARQCHAPGQGGSAPSRAQGAPKGAKGCIWGFATQSLLEWHTGHSWLDLACAEGVEGQCRLQAGSWLWLAGDGGHGQGFVSLWPPPDTGAAFRHQFHISSLSCSRSLLLPSASTQGQLLAPTPSRVCTAAHGDRAWKCHGREVPGGAVSPDCSFCFQPLPPISGCFSLLHLILTLEKAARSQLSWGWRMFPEPGLLQSHLCHTRFQGEQHPDPSRDPTAAWWGWGFHWLCNQERGEQRSWETGAVLGSGAAL